VAVEADLDHGATVEDPFVPALGSGGHDQDAPVRLRTEARGSASRSAAGAHLRLGRIARDRAKAAVEQDPLSPLSVTRCPSQYGR